MTTSPVSGRRKSVSSVTSAVKMWCSALADFLPRKPSELLPLPSLGEKFRSWNRWIQMSSCSGSCSLTELSTSSEKSGALL